LLINKDLSGLMMATHQTAKSSTPPLKVVLARLIASQPASKQVQSHSAADIVALNPPSRVWSLGTSQHCCTVVVVVVFAQ
jgi:hypothetical protein